MIRGISMSNHLFRGTLAGQLAANNHRQPPETAKTESDQASNFPVVIACSLF